MARNVEIKARIDHVDDMVKKASTLADEGPVEIEQDDTFFRCAGGRLKLRVFSSAEGELIYYRRPDQAGPKASFYVVTRTGDPEGLREALTLAYGQSGRVVKHRTLFYAGRTRIHVDRVEGLGSFVELEVVLGEGESVEAGEREARALMVELGIEEERLVEGAYVDMLTKRYII